jgi:cysteine-rich CPCC protein
VLDAQERERFERRLLAPGAPRPLNEPCYCCGFVTLLERGANLMCPVCFWEDDASIGNELDVCSLRNRMTLATARANFEQFGACDPNEFVLEGVLDAQERERFDAAHSRQVPLAHSPDAT